MSHFLYISDVFCPWCYGFSKNIAQIKEDFALPFEVYGGALVEPAVSLKNNLKRNPNLSIFIEKMYSMTGIKISESYEKLMRSDASHSIFMDSRKASHLFYSLKHFKPDYGLEIMLFLQNIFYEQGKDVFLDDTILEFAKQYQINSDDIFSYYNTKESADLAYEETEKGFDILGEVILYPTLYYVENGNNHFISRGYVQYEDCKNKINEVMEKIKTGNTTISPQLMGKSCTLDGKCD